MGRRIASIWLPRLETDLIERREPHWRERPLALHVETGPRLIVVAVNAAAAAEGVAPGMALADARALAAGLATRPTMPPRRAKALLALQRWLDRFTPLVAIDGPDGFLLEMAGATHLFGGEAAFMARLIQGLEGLGFAVRAAMADAPGGAWALARHGRQGEIAPVGEIRAALARLPVACLRLPPEIAGRLARLGLARVGDLYALPRAALVRRFGVQTVTRLDQALGAAPEPISPTRPPAPYVVRLGFVEPIADRAGIETALAGLIEKLTTRLMLDDRGATALELTFLRVDGGRQSLEVRAGEPTRDGARIARLFAEKLGLIDPGFGIEAASLAAPVSAEAIHPQRDALAAAAAPEALARLIDTLGNRLGFDAVARFEPQDRWRPERSVRLRPATADCAPTPLLPAPGPRPLELLQRPTPIVVEVDSGAQVDLGALAPPTALRQNGQWRTLRHAIGPERISPEWRTCDPDWPADRDYWRAEDETGARLWLYRQGPLWFLHGRFA